MATPGESYEGGRTTTAIECEYPLPNSQHAFVVSSPLKSINRQSINQQRNTVKYIHIDVSYMATVHIYVILIIPSDPVFGCELSDLCERQGTNVPKFFMQFMQHIEKVGLDVVGIYRLSGNAASVNKLRYLVEQGKV